MRPTVPTHQNVPTDQLCDVLLFSCCMHRHVQRGRRRYQRWWWLAAETTFRSEALIKFKFKSNFVINKILCAANARAAAGTGGAGADGDDASDAAPLLSVLERARAARAEQKEGLGSVKPVPGSGSDAAAGPSTAAPAAVPVAATGAEGASVAAPARAPRARLVLPCMHTFCEPCIGAWVQEQKKTTCPVCRKPIDEHGDAPGPGDATPPPRCANDGAAEADAATDAAFTQAYGGPYRGYRDERYRARGYTRADAARDEMLFRMGRIRHRHPRYVTDAMLLAWNRDIAAGRPLDASQWRAFTLADPAVRQATAAAGSHGAHVKFGGGSSRGGSGRGGGW
mmetsp:Transcript_41994/g.125710  ORF Transcript_41994/g.125710 Transcript_41994/m.125710 type:complete len:339 (-) Transcript_41994:566-1582(-)|eukprot:365297-Chlamydomonas_euryale.AAC.3